MEGSQWGGGVPNITVGGSHCLFGGGRDVPVPPLPPPGGVPSLHLCGWRRHLLHPSVSGAPPLKTNTPPKEDPKCGGGSAVICPTELPHSSAPQLCPIALLHNTAPQCCPTVLPHSSAPQLCPTALPHSTVPTARRARGPWRGCGCGFRADTSCGMETWGGHGGHLWGRGGHLGGRVGTYGAVMGTWGAIGGQGWALGGQGWHLWGRDGIYGAGMGTWGALMGQGWHLGGQGWALGGHRAGCHRVSPPPFPTQGIHSPRPAPSFTPRLPPPWGCGCPIAPPLWGWGGS